MNRQSRLSDEVMLRRRGRRDEPDLWTATSAEGMVATAHYHATRCGAQILSQGGNAIDAAVAAGAALGVCEPGDSGLGGMAMMLVYHAASERLSALEGACRVPLAATPELVGASPRTRGHRAVAVPTWPAVMARAMTRYGTMKTDEVLAPAIALAKEGFPVSPVLHILSKRYRGRLARHTGRLVFLDDRKRPFRVGTILRQPALAATLTRLAEAGFEDFYQGEIAREICTDMRANGGFLSAEDLRAIPWPREVEPLTRTCGERTLCTLGPPAGGHTLIHMLNLLACLAPREGIDPDSPEGLVLLAEIIGRARRDRQAYYRQIAKGKEPCLKELLSLDQARQVAAEMRAAGVKGQETSHLCVFDRKGNVVSLTQSLDRSFGAKTLTPSLGFLYNSYMCAFKIRNTRHPHFLRPGALARSNAAPTIVFSNGRPELAVGAAGSERVASAIFQVMARLGRQSPFEAVQAPRLHTTPQGMVLYERERFSADAIAALARRGFDLKCYAPYSLKLACLQLALVQGDRFIGVADPRRDGAASGPCNG